MRLTEGDLQITFNNAIVCRKFDDHLAHGLSHCMKAVDFIVELHDRYPNSKQWSNRFVHRIGVFDIAAWNHKFPDYQIVRLSSLNGI